MIKIWGKVIRGKNRGKKIGIPTINLRLHRNIPQGIYVSLSKFDGRVYKSVSFIGAAKTFGETKVFLETYILDFSRDIYGEWISIHLLKKIRDNRKFATSRQLLVQIKKDILQARIYFKHQ